MTVETYERLEAWAEKSNYNPDPKPVLKKRKPIRILDHKARERKLEKDRMCRCGCGRLANSAHHIVRKGSPHFGDDVEENLMPTFHECHMSWHDGKDIKLPLTEAEQEYVFNKLGREPGMVYLEDHYGMEFA